LFYWTSPTYSLVSVASLINHLCHCFISDLIFQSLPVDFQLIIGKKIVTFNSKSITYCLACINSIRNVTGWMSTPVAFFHFSLKFQQYWFLVIDTILPLRGWWTTKSTCSNFISLRTESTSQTQVWTISVHCRNTFSYLFVLT
jgi:hypothetical protein